MKLSNHNLSRYIVIACAVVALQLVTYAHSNSVNRRSPCTTADHVPNLRGATLETPMKERVLDDLHKESVNVSVENLESEKPSNVDKTKSAAAMHALLKSFVISLVDEEYGAHCELCGGPHPYAHSVVCLGGSADCINHPGEDCRKAVVV